MSKIKSCLTIDGNYLMYKDVFILNKTRTVGQDLGALLRRDFEKTTSIYPFDKIFFVSDMGKSWRRNEYEEYKGNREKDNNIDWDLVYQDYNDFKNEIAQNKRVQMIQVNGLEGDDIIGYIINESNKLGYSNLVVAADSDLHQLLKFSKSKNYINILWNYKFSDERLYLPRNYQIFMQHIEEQVDQGMDLFDLNYDSEFLSMIDTLINRTKIKEVYYEQSLFEKILSGDKKDNIFSVIKLKNKEIDENGTGIGTTGAEKCYKLYKDTYGESIIDFKSEDYLDKATEIAAFYKKVNNRSDIKEIIRENIINNHKLLNLDGSQMPINLKKQLQNKIIL